ncbi:ABC transporter ATP-binding protein [Burkholderia ubonensis]|uniref:ABC transporter ATP-binding protein n=1 Tax=Burkholderia ubonensis TaxID=101571 RepID=UPI0009B3921C|nr:ABC transporter ATP-binding protein [Burkholderia ubonensis]
MVETIGNTHRHACDDVIRLEEISHAYRTGAGSQQVIHDVTLSVAPGQSCAIVGASGSGKSTLLNIIGLLDRPTSGRLFLKGRDMTLAESDVRSRARNEIIGFVFQSFNLLPRLSALDNVALPLTYRGYARDSARMEAQRQIERVGLGHRAQHRPADLSGGQRQRIAIARALVTQPSLILADEPTGNLDTATASDILDLLLALNRDQHVTLVVVTHDVSIADRMQRCLQVQDGRLAELAREARLTHD